MADYQFEITEDARADLACYTAFERKTILTAIRDQLAHQPLQETRNRKTLRENPIAPWELRIEKFRVFYEVDKENDLVVIMAVGHKNHEQLFIRGKKVRL